MVWQICKPIYVFLVWSDKQKIVPAITHIDGTARVQTVEKRQISNVFDESFKITGVKFLNTSFNENEPIVMKLEEALNCIIRNDMDYLVIGNFIIKK